jgi:predicted small secreted protein
MKKLLISLVSLIALLTGCNQSVSQGQGDSPEDIAKLAYEWEKAYFDNNYEREQELLYEEGSFEVHKTRDKKESGLKFEDIRFELYHDKELDQYYVFADFKNPIGENSVEEELLIRKKGEEWKVDTSKSLDIVREEVSGEFERAACINCK